MANAIVVASGSAGVQAITGDGTLVGWAVRESSGGAGAVASVTLRDGTSTAGPPRAYMSLVALGSDARLLPGIEFKTGIFVDRTTGSTELVLYFD